jgi:TolB-like protein
MPKTVLFDCYEVDLHAGQLYKHGIRIRLRDQSFQVLAALLENPGEVITRDELRHRLWRDDIFVDFEHNLNTAVGRLREALSDSAEHPRFIETLPKRGYRFLESVSELPRAPETKTTKRVRLVVLPFLNLSGDPAQEYFSDAITDEIITVLAGLAPEQLAVIARTTAMHYKGSHKDVTRIGRELSVDYVVEGGVHRSDDHVSVNVQLIQVSDQTHLFARKYDSQLRDLVKLHNCVAQAIAAHIGIAIPTAPAASISAVEQRARKPTEDLAAYNLYLQGRYHMYKHTPEDNTKAKQYFEQTITRDPGFAPAYDSLGELYWSLGFLGFMPPREACTAGLFCALRAIEIDNTLAETHALVGMYRKQVDFNWSEVQREMGLALQLNPLSPVVKQRHAVSYLMPQGRLEEAVAELEFALASDPLSVDVRVWLATMLWLGRHYDLAMEQARRLIHLDPAHFLGHGAKGHIHCMEQAFDQAVPALRRACQLSGDAPMVLGWLGLALAQSANGVEARSLLNRLHAIAAQAYVPPTSFAWIHFGLGEIDDAFVWMDRAIEARDHMMTPIKTYPFLDPIRSDPRFAALLRKMNLET